MQFFDQADNTQLLSTLAGKPVAESLMQRFGGLTSLAQASFDELRQVKGVGQSKAAAINVYNPDKNWDKADTTPP